MSNSYPDYGPLRFCPLCGDRLRQRRPPQEDRPRLVCQGCGRILYVNPKVVVGTIPERRGRLLLVQRGIEPSYGTWTFPGGFLEMSETVEEAALRETAEEVGLQVRIKGLLGVYSRPDAGIVVVVFRAQAPTGRPVNGHEVLQSRWFRWQEIPWDNLSFVTTLWALRDWVAARCRTARLNPAVDVPAAPTSYRQEHGGGSRGRRS